MISTRVSVAPRRAWTFAAMFAVPVLALTVVGTARADERPISFRHDVLPALSKQGCSSGACHGSPSGKGGFRLSLRGFDPEVDRQTLLRDAPGRRVNVFEPDESLLLRKPLMQVAHGGGRKLRASDPAFRLLRSWIEVGCPDDPAEAPVATRIDVSPRDGEWAWPRHRQQLTVRAHFSDGTSRDITQLAAFTSSDERVARVTADGLVQAETGGETTVMVRYLDFVTTSDLSFLKPVPGFRWDAPPVRNEIDAIVFARLKKLQIPASPLCSDSEFLRRASLDVLGLLPSRGEAEAFLADLSPDKRARLVDQLLERREHAEFWAQKWGDLLRVKGSKISPAGVQKFHRWLVRAMHQNMPHDRFARSLLTAKGSSFVNPPANFYRAASGVNDSAEAMSQLFLGIRIQCAKCHNHPFDRWSQDHYYGIGAFFARVQQRPVGATSDVVVWLDDVSEVTQPRTGETMLPWLPLEGEVDISNDRDRREVLADWLTSPDNPFFARVAANRIWGELFGRGIVEPVDDFRADNPPSHPDLLDWLAQRFTASDYDRRELIRTILNSSVYQLSSRELPLNKHEDRYFSHAGTRLLSAEQLLDAIGHVTGVPGDFRGLPTGTRATGLPSPEFGNDFLRVFGQPARNTVCACERTEDPKLAQTLQLINGSLIPTKLRDPRGRLHKWFDDVPTRLVAAGEPPREGVVAWFRADTGVETSSRSTPVDGQPVAHWLNQAVAGLDCLQPNIDQQPLWISAAAGGLPALRFDGRDDFLHNTEENLLPSGSARTVVVVGQVADTTGGALVTFRRGRRAGSSVFTAQCVNIAGNLYVYSDGINGPGNTTVSAGQIAKLREPFIAVYRSSGPGEKLGLELNGADASPVQPGGVGKDAGVTGFTIGSREDIAVSQQIWNGDISEVLVYDHNLSDEDRRHVGSYLATKYNLDTPHPRRTTPVDNSLERLDSEFITDLYFAAYSRPPTQAELSFAQRHIAGADSRRDALEELAWALMNSKEFVFQH